MLALAVEILVLTNVELEHHATYGSLDDLREAFRGPLSHASGAVVIWERPELLALAAPARRATPRGSCPTSSRRSPSKEAARALAGAARAWRSPCPAPTMRSTPSARWRPLAWPGPRQHLAVAGLAGFTGAGRRFQPPGSSAAGALIYDDYAHHPTEIEATLDAARALPHERLVAVFQPHLYSRTGMLARELGRGAGVLADPAAVLDVYGARERPEEHPGAAA